MASEDKALVQVSTETKTRLDNLGKKGDSYEDIIKKLLDQNEKRKAG
jgi:hypothetical protein